MARNTRYLLGICALVAAACLVAGCARPRAQLAFEASPWPEADALFRQDPQWLGGDGASSVDLGAGRVLWLFGDSFIAGGASRDRARAKIIRNSVGIQKGYDPSHASMAFFWDASGREPAAFFNADHGGWLWPGDGIRLGQGLLIFFMKVKQDTNALGFSSDGWTAALVQDPDQAPPAWDQRRLQTPPNPFGVTVGSACVLERGGWVYAFGARESGGHDAFLARWPAGEAAKGDLSGLSWWMGPEKGWGPQGPPAPVFLGGQAEFTVDFDADSGFFYEVQAVGFGAAVLAARASRGLTGPWSAPRTFYAPPEGLRKNALIYAAKAHPELSGAGLVLTYCVNSMELGDVLSDNALYFPRFLRATARLTPSRP